MRVGLLGAGRIARRFHLPILASMPGVDLVAVAEPMADARDACLTLAPGTASFHADFAELLDAHPLDAVVICLPPALHSRAAVAGFARGLHVYVEKPLAISAGDGRGMLDAWRRAGTVGMVGFNHRFHPLARALKDEVARGRVGDVTRVRTAFAGAQRTLPAWKRAREFWRWGGGGGGGWGGGAAPRGGGGRARCGGVWGRANPAEARCSTWRVTRSTSCGSCSTPRSSK